MFTKAKGFLGCSTEAQCELEQETHLGQILGPCSPALRLRQCQTCKVRVGVPWCFSRIVSQSSAIFDGGLPQPNVVVLCLTAALVDFFLVLFFFSSFLNPFKCLASTYPREGVSRVSCTQHKEFLFPFVLLLLSLGSPGSCIGRNSKQSFLIYLLNNIHLHHLACL